MKPDLIPPEHPENPHFVFVDEAVPGVQWDAKYATWDNFTGKPVDGYQANRIVGTPALCSALEKARTAAATQGFGLLLWDGYRPQRAVDRFLRWTQEPEDYRTKARHYPNIDRAEIFPRGLRDEPYPTPTSTFPSNTYGNDRLGHDVITTAAGGRVTDKVPGTETKITSHVRAA
ncbi:MAG: hypothetical protein J2P23_13340 [Microlunatus sp.]|nr:hypothetical protein [Microlunatus sp.]